MEHPSDGSVEIEALLRQQPLRMEQQPRVQDQLATLGLLVVNRRQPAKIRRAQEQLILERLAEQAHRQRNFRRLRVAPELLDEVARDVVQAIDDLGHVDRDADRSRLVGHGSPDRLPDPPGGIGAEFESAAVIELLDRPHQAEIAFLDQVEHG